MSELEKVTRTVDNAAFFASVKMLLDEGRDVEFTVVGSSMYPMLRNKKDSVIIEKVPYEQLQLRDVILFSPMSDVYILHRIIKLSEKGFSTAGDGNLFIDGFFPKSAFVARVKAFERKGKMKKVTSPLFKLYSLLWVRLFRIRKPLIRLLRHMNGLKVRVRSLFKK